MVGEPDASPFDAAPVDAGPSPDGGPAAPTCARRFGDGITAEYGRLDGTVRAVVVPDDPDCRSDDNHVYVQIDVAGATYLASINVESTLQPNDRDVRFATVDAPLAFGAWEEGWHPGIGPLDYAGTLGVHSGGAFEAVARDALAARIGALVPVGSRVSAYFDGFESGEGGHRIHRNNNGGDGALVVVSSTGDARYLLFHFAGQSF